MRRKTKFCCLLFLSLIISFSLYGADLNHNVLPYKKKLKEKILGGEIFSESKVKSLVLVTEGKTEEIQELHFSIAGLHPKSCEYALKKLSLYENYSQFIDFVKKSDYDEEKKEINFLLSHVLLPYEMRLIFKLPRITTTGVYPFEFDDDEDISFHLGAFMESRLVSVASFFYERNTLFTDLHQYQLRGMATLPEFQGQGLSSELLNMAFPIIKQNFCTLVWCNARVSAVGYYQKVGFQIHDEKPFEIEGIGPHVLMYKNI